jgi:transcriptional regulator with PAS, ATPase and Fis domain
VVVDCTSLPDTLFESELFGHVRGAFTGAVATRRGLLESAAGGTVFIDEIGELSAPLQAKLLRVLQEHAVRRLGDNDSVSIDVRIVAATHRDLKQRVASGAFRDDLYYRLNVVTITVPPLRERLSDLPLLAQHFLRKHAEAAGKTITGLARETLATLSSYAWPGNVRELEHAIERAVVLASTELLLPEDLPVDVRGKAAAGTAEAGEAVAKGHPMTLEQMKRWYVGKVLGDVNGNKVRAAEILGIDRRTLYRMLERAGDAEEPDES